MPQTSVQRSVRYVPAPRYCSTDFDGASSPQLRTSLTDIIALLLYIERNKNTEINNLYQRPSLCAVKLNILFVAIEINE